jgi:hypothetical protein
MSPHKQKMKQQNGKPKRIMILVSLNRFEHSVLELGGSICWYAHFANVDSSVRAHLKTVAINECCDAVTRYQDIAVIHISYYVSSFVDRGESARDVSGDV